MEFLLVIFPADRGVLIDGVVAGLTNHLITLAPGTYTVSLDGPIDFSPDEHEILVEESSPLSPARIEFA